MPLLVLLHDALVGLRAGVDLILQRVQLQFADAVELVSRQRHVRRQREQAHREERRGVVRGRDGGEHVGELGHRHHEHDPQRQRLRPVLQPRAALDEERRDGAGQKQRQAAVGGVVRDAVVGVGEVPKVVGDDPGPDHVRPDHVLRRVLRNEDAEPAADGEDVQNTRDAVHDVPRTRYRPEVLNDAALPQREAEHLEVADDRLGDVDRQDERREAQCPALLVQVVGLAVLAAPFHKAQSNEPEASRQRGIGLHPVEPGAGAVLVAGCGGFGPHEERERDRHDCEQDEPTPQFDASQLVEGHQGEEDEEPNDPVNRIGCLVENAHEVSFRRHGPARFRSGNAACDVPAYGPIRMQSSK